MNGDSPIILLLKFVFKIGGAIITTVLILGFAFYLAFSIASDNSLLTKTTDALIAILSWRGAMIFCSAGLMVALLAHRVHASKYKLPNASPEWEIVVYISLVGLIISLL